MNIFFVSEVSYSHNFWANIICHILKGKRLILQSKWSPGLHQPLSQSCLFLGHNKRHVRWFLRWYLPQFPPSCLKTDSQPVCSIKGGEGDILSSVTLATRNCLHYMKCYFFLFECNWRRGYLNNKMKKIMNPSK